MLKSLIILNPTGVLHLMHERIVSLLRRRGYLLELFKVLGSWHHSRRRRSLSLNHLWKLKMDRPNSSIKLSSQGSLYENPGSPEINKPGVTRPQARLTQQ